MTSITHIQTPFGFNSTAAEVIEGIDLSGRHAIVTGASSGIGVETARVLATAGAAVTLAVRNTDAGARTATEITDATGNDAVDAKPLDLADPASIAAFARAWDGPLDILVNNAGVMLLGPVASAPLPEWQQMVELNVLGLLYCAHAALPHLLRAAGDGPRQVADMVNISSVAGRAARNGNGVYSLTKHGVGAFSESLRQEVAKRYVRVSLVEPGATATELAGHNRPEVLESIRNQFGQRMDASDIADAITYIVTRPRHVAVNEILIRPTEQER
jgi:NADP-dependent 3-hydroxy acid dehydrogenase YdfG